MVAALAGYIAYSSLIARALLLVLGGIDATRLVRVSWVALSQVIMRLSCRSDQTNQSAPNVVLDAGGNYPCWHPRSSVYCGLIHWSSSEMVNETMGFPE